MCLINKTDDYINSNHTPELSNVNNIVKYTGALFKISTMTRNMYLIILVCKAFLGLIEDQEMQNNQDALPVSI